MNDMRLILSAMFPGKIKLITIALFSLFCVQMAFSQDLLQKEEEQAALEWGLDLLDRYFSEEGSWKVYKPENGESVLGLVHFIKDAPIDTIILDINRALEDTTLRFVYRLPEHVPDSLDIPGYFSAPELEQNIEQLWGSLRQEYMKKEIHVPEDLISDFRKKANVIPQGEGKRLFENGIYDMPDSLQIPDVVPDSLMQSPNDFKRFLKLDSIRSQYIEERREEYNDSVIWAYRDSIVEDYRQRQLELAFQTQKERLIDSVQMNNYQVLKQYNDSVVEAVNDSITLILENLVVYADLIDTTRLRMENLLGEESSVLLQNRNQYSSHFWLKNEQNDSLRLRVRSLDKQSIQLLIDDGVRLSRFTAKKTKDFDFSSLTKTYSGLTGVDQKYQVLTPWRIGGNGTAGLTQVYLENWKKGGKSSLSLLMVLNGFANYSSSTGKVKWENSAEIRNGWIRPGGSEAELQKNDDKFEFTSRLGVSAFKKWYYSSEFNYETQFFNGFKYPTEVHPDPISAFMSPARTFFKIGLDYKPNRNFSLFLSPVTAKNVFIKDTVKIDQKRFGIEAGKRGSWNMGMNADLKYQTNLTSDIGYATKYKMFIDYQKPFSKFDIYWENHFTMQLSDYINMRFMVDLKYDSSVTFPVYNANDEQIGEKAKLQVKEFFSIGFSYKINRQVTRTRKRN